MSVPEWFWPASGATARSVALAPYSAGVAVADWLTPTLWPFQNSTFQAGIPLGSGTPGISALSPDGSGGVWAVGFGGTFWHQPAAGSATSGQLPSGSVYTGCVFTNGQPYFASSNGVVYTSGGATVGSWPIPAIEFTGSGTVLGAILPGSGLGTMSTAGTTGLIALPGAIASGTCLWMAAGQLTAIGGWQNAPALSGAAAAALSPQTAFVMAGVGSGRALLWGTPGPLSDAWSQTQILTGLANLTALAWTPDGFHVMGASPASGAVQVLSYASGVLSLLQTVTVSGACSVMVAGDSLHALVAQSGQSQLATLSFTGTWATGQPITGFPGVTSVISQGPSGAAVAYSSGIAYLALSSGGWGVVNTVGLGYTPTVLTSDPFQQVYAAASGKVSVISASGLTAPTLLGSGSWAGGVPTGLAVQQGRIVLAVPADNKLYLFGESGANAWTQQASAALSLGTPVGLGLSDTTLFVMGSAATQTYGFSGTPFTLTNVQSGAVAQRGASWTQTVLGLNATPAALTYDASGNLAVVTTQNSLWSVASGGAVLSSSIIQSYAGQPQPVPITVSDLLTASGVLYAATSLPGTLGALGVSTSTNLYNDNGVLALFDSTGWPATSGIAATPGAFWSNGGVVSIVSGATPNPLAPPVYFGQITSSGLLAMGGQNLPITTPTSGSLQIWNNLGEANIA